MSNNHSTFSQNQKVAFAAAANPHEWLLVAVNLHEQAQLLRQNRGRSLLTLRQPGHEPVTWDDTNRATYLLAAFAMENMLKAFLVYEHPNTVAEGYLKKITTHDLGKLADHSSLVPYKLRDRWVFEALAQGNESWARYPCGRNADDLRPQGLFISKLWYKYYAMMAAYTVKMQQLLTKGWIDPYGNQSTWRFE